MNDEALAADVLIDPALGGRVAQGLTDAKRTAERAAVAQGSAADRRVLDQPLASLAEFWRWTDEHERARAALIDLLQRAHDMGDENAPPWLLFLLGDTERLLGNLEAALVHARDGQEAAEQSGQPLFAGQNLALSSLVHAQLGRRRRRCGPPSVCSSKPRQLRASSRGRGARPSRARPRRAGGDRRAARVSLVFARNEAIAEPGVTRFAVDLIEALIELGRCDEAGEYSTGTKAMPVGSREPPHGPTASGAADCSPPRPGTWLPRSRRTRRRSRAMTRSTSLSIAGERCWRSERRSGAQSDGERPERPSSGPRTCFDGVGAALWSERARAELRRISGRAPTTGALTPAEERVAVLVVSREDEHRGRVRPLRLRPHGRRASLPDLREARHPAPSRAGFARLAARQSQGIDDSNTGDSPVSPDRVAP